MGDTALWPDCEDQNHKFMLLEQNAARVQGIDYRRRLAGACSEPTRHQHLFVLSADLDGRSECECMTAILEHAPRL